MTLQIKPTHKVITDYYQAIHQAKDTNQLHEGAVAPHFANVLRYCLSQFPNLTLIEQYSIKRDGRNSLRADGAIVDKQTNVLLYGIWEAKDSKDKLEREVQNKFKDGYPADNILFQSPDQIIIYQHGNLAFNEIITDSPKKLIDGLGLFLNYKPPVYAQWEEAIGAFKDKVGALGQSLVQIISNELKISGTFKRAFEHFSDLCRSTINPNLAPAAIIEMLVQHLLTERLFRTVFNNPDFISKNVIAREIETVIRALTARSFNRNEFLQNLDRFYVAIEETASTIHAYSRKQDFLNVVYENFFQGFAVKVADTHGIVYTPQPIVDFMVQSVQEILHREFNESLANPGVNILDPFVGTGNFILRIMQEIANTNPTPSLPMTGEGAKNPTPALPMTGEGANLNLPPVKGGMRGVDQLKHKYANELHCNEIMLLPYYIASMNIEHAYYEHIGEYTPFTGICLVDTFELAEPKQRELSFVPENTVRIKAQQAAPIFVIIGNPPYNVGQQNENDDNKNRKYPYIDGVVAETYAKYSHATNKSRLSDAYIKAFTWATERLKTQDRGIIAFVSNNGFLDGLAADGMRKQLGKQFNSIYILNLGGNVRQNPKLSGTTHNVFGIQVGVAITILVKTATNESNIYYTAVDQFWTKLQKFNFLQKQRHILNVDVRPIIPDAKHNWLTEGLDTDFLTFTPLGSQEGKAAKNSAQEVIFQIYSLGANTNRDVWAYNFNREELTINMRACIDAYNVHVFRYSRLEPKPDIDSFVTYDDKKLSWSSSLKQHLARGTIADFTEHNIRTSLYRPFTKQNIYFDKIFTHRRGQFPSIFPTSATEQENRVICISAVGSRIPFICFVSNIIVNLSFVIEPVQCFPFYTYNADGTNRQENLTDWALTAYQTHYRDQSIDKWNIFYYVYGLLHHPGYRTKYAANLKRDLPHIPYIKDFWKMSDAGKRLAELHLNYEMQPEYSLQTTITGHLNWRVEKMRLSKDKTTIIYNHSLTLHGIPAEVFNYKLGNRSALEWVIDQYQISTDNRSGIVNDPNRLDDERYIVRLIQQIITVSLETVRLVQEINNNEGI